MYRSNAFIPFLFSISSSPYYAFSSSAHQGALQRLLHHISERMLKVHQVRIKACFGHRETFSSYYFILNKGNRNFIRQNCDFTSHDSDFLSPGVNTSFFFFFPSQFRRSLDAAPEIFSIDFLFISIYLYISEILLCQLFCCCCSQFRWLPLLRFHFTSRNRIRGTAYGQRTIPIQTKPRGQSILTGGPNERLHLNNLHIIDPSLSDSSIDSIDYYYNTAPEKSSTARSNIRPCLQFDYIYIISCFYGQRARRIGLISHSFI